MACQLFAMSIDAHDPLRLAQCWAGFLGWELADDDGVTLLPSDDTGFRFRFPRTQQQVGPNQVPVDLTSTSLEDQQETVARVIGLGGRRIDVGQVEVSWIVMADPGGDELWVLHPEGPTTPGLPGGP